jgi:PAS domain S-box-containing protein
MLLSLLREWLSVIQAGPGDPSDDDCLDCSGRPFVPAKRLCERDYVIIDMLNSQGHESVSFCITDPRQPDNPVIYINHGFTKLTGYDPDDIVGRNCRFLQGPDTSEEDRRSISDAIKGEEECSVNLVNYKKDGTKFVNEVSYSVAAVGLLHLIGAGSVAIVVTIYDDL